MSTTVPLSLPLVRALEERAFNAWPAHQTVLHQGWVFRLAAGFTQRANSVNALEAGAPFDGVLDAATALYARHGLPTVFRLSPLADPAADIALARAGYAVHDPSLVLHMPLSRLAADNPSATTTSVHLEASASTDWLDGFAQASAMPRHHRALHTALVHAIAHPAVFAQLRSADDQAVGFGLAVMERGAVGLFDIAVTSDQRGGGHGRALVRALLQWAARAGAESAYLQVRAENTAAIRLYESLGFETAYGYHYRAKP
jgi:ribosomal protein S18 acetylase RimI-like enzyme